MLAARSVECHDPAMSDVPDFLWWDGVELSRDELRVHLRSPDPVVRAQWAGRILREASYREIWEFLSIRDIVRDWELIHRNLGRKRAQWEWLMDGWRRDGLIRD